MWNGTHSCFRISSLEKIKCAGFLRYQIKMFVSHRPNSTARLWKQFCTEKNWQKLDTCSIKKSQWRKIFFTSKTSAWHLNSGPPPRCKRSLNYCIKPIGSSIKEDAPITFTIAYMSCSSCCLWVRKGGTCLRWLNYLYHFLGIVHLWIISWDRLPALMLVHVDWVQVFAAIGSTSHVMSRYFIGQLKVNWCIVAII